MADVLAHGRVWRQCRDRAAAYAVAFATDKAWSIVFRFYAAVHLTQAYLISKNVPRFEASGHAERTRAIKSAPELGRRFEVHYRDLKDLSESVRYDPGFVATARDHDAAERCLGVVESFLLPKLKARGFDPES